jgi:hypothetical protein
MIIQKECRIIGLAKYLMRKGKLRIAYMSITISIMQVETLGNVCGLTGDSQNMGELWFA